MPWSAQAWAESGHRIVGAIAEARMGPRARAMVREIAGDQSLSSAEIATWADHLRDRSTRPWHYVNIPFPSGSYVPARDCPGGACAVAALRQAEAVLSDAGPRGGAVARADALRWLVHLVADLHQPLHAGDGRDRGGNDLRVRLRHRRQPINLHRVWDAEVVSPLVARRTPVQAVRDILTRVSPAEAAAWAAQSDPAGWAEESNREARSIYQEIGSRPGDRGIAVLTPWNYELSQQPRVERVLARAGIRLAVVLDRIASRRTRL